MKNRLESLDIFRGLTIALMIVVNTPGDWSTVYAPLKHAQWHGFTAADVVFPSFVFIMGVSSWFSFKSSDHRLTRELGMKILKRVVILFLLGVLLYAFPYYNRPLSTWRILGVLQRIALCYGIGSVLSLVLSPKRIIGLSAAILLVYWGILNTYGDLTLENNAVRMLDLKLFGASHLWSGDGLPFDPEGLLSTLPAIVTFLIGNLVGQLIGTATDRQVTVRQMFMWSVVLLIIGGLWHFIFPINKKLWSSSFVLWAGGLSVLGFAICYYVVDILEVKNWGKAFKIFGTNAILAYLVSEYLILILTEMKINEAQDIIINGHEAAFRYGFALWMGHTHFASFIFALIYTAVCWLIVYLFYRKNIFLKV